MSYFDDDYYKIPLAEKTFKLARKGGLLHLISAKPYKPYYSSNSINDDQYEKED